MKRPASKRPAANGVVKRPAVKRSHDDAGDKPEPKTEDDGMLYASDEDMTEPAKVVDARPDTDDMFAASDIEGAGTPGPASSKVDVSTIRSQGVGVDSFVHWAFTDRRDTPLIECFSRTMRVCGGRGEFADGVPIASICTGWGVAEMVLDCLNEKLAEMDPKLAKFYPAFMCESETWKADYLHKAFPDCKFIFSDMHDLGTGRAHDIISGKKVEVPEAEGVVAGYPCRSLSLQNNNPKSFTDKSSSTGGGFHSTMRYVKRNQRLKWVLLENVQGMFHVRKKFGNECPMEIQGKQMRKMGFKEVFAFLLNSSDYGLAHSRPRAWVLYIREDQIRSQLSPELFMDTLKFSGTDLGFLKFLKSKDATCTAPIASTRRTRKGDKWKDGLEKSCDSLGKDKVQRNLNRLTALVKGKVSMTERELALLAVAVTEMLAAGLDPYSEHFVIEVEKRFASMQRATMQRSSLFFAFVFQICWISASTRTCLPGAILEPDRMNITLDGISLPVGIWQSVPGASTVVSHLYAIVLSEKLGFNVHMDIGAASELIIGKLAGCSHEGFAITGDCGPPRRFHVAFEDWITGSEWQKKALVDAEPYGVPVNLGSPGYAGKSGMAVLNGGWRAALADSGLALNFYRSYDASWFDPSKYTADVQMVDLARLKTCENSAELGYPGLAEVYVRATGDLEGVVEVNGTKRLNCWQDRWWVAPACRGNISKCSPVIMPGTAWGMPQMMQQAFWHQMPLAFATATDGDFASVATELQSLAYIFLPDESVLSSGEEPPKHVIFPEHNSEEYANSTYKTMFSEQGLSKWAAAGFEDASTMAYTVARNLQIQFSDAMLLLQRKIELNDVWEAACEWLRKNEAKWTPWVPVETNCFKGFGMVDKDGQFLGNRSNAAGCGLCLAGTASERFNDDVGSTFICKQCPPGYHQAETYSTTCEPCPAGTKSDTYGSTKCEACGVGLYQPDTAQTLCASCPALRTTMLLAGSSISDCVCEEGHIEKDGTCEVCSEGLHCPTGSTLSKLQSADGVEDKRATFIKGGYFSDPSNPLKSYKCTTELYCPGGAPGRCQGGREGLTCGECAEGFFGTSAECQECGAAMPLLWCALVCALAAALLGSYYLTTSKYTTKATVLATTTASLGMLLGLFQNLGVLNTVKLEWPSELSDLLTFAAVFTLNLDGLGFSCAAGGSVMRYASTAIFFWLVLCLYPIIGFLTNFVPVLVRKQLQWQEKKTTNITGQFLQVSFTTMANVALMPFTCYEHPTATAAESLLKYSNVLCGTGDHAVMMVFGACVILLATGFFCLCCWAALTAPSWDNDDLLRIRFLIFRFRPNVWWFGLVLLARGPLLSFPAVIATNAPVLHLLMMAAILQISLSLQLWFLPWKSPILNLVDAISVQLLVMLLAVSIGFVDGSNSKDVLQTVGTVISSLVISILCFMVCLSLISLIYRETLGRQQDLKVFNLGKVPESRKVFEFLMDIVASFQRSNSEQREKMVRDLEQLSVYDLTMIKQALDILADDLQMTVTRARKSTTGRICSGMRSVEQQMRRNSTASAHEEYDAGEGRDKEPDSVLFDIENASLRADSDIRSDVEASSVQSATV